MVGCEMSPVSLRAFAEDPHDQQNLAWGGRVVPQWAHPPGVLAKSCPPQLRQNFASRGPAVLHRGHTIVRSVARRLPGYLFTQFTNTMGHCLHNAERQ